MKRSRFTLLACASLVGFAAGCDGELIGPTTANTAPIAHVRSSAIGLPLPANSTVLHGFGQDAESNIRSYSWKKVSGPASYSIVSPNLPETEVADLEQGQYEFELTVTDKGGLTGKATVEVFVYDPRLADANELVFKNLTWECPMFCSVSIKNVKQYIPPSTRARVFVWGAGEWIEAKPEAEWAGDVQYTYKFSENTLVVYTYHGQGAVAVKVTF